MEYNKSINIVDRYFLEHQEHLLELGTINFTVSVIKLNLQIMMCFTDISLNISKMFRMSINLYT